MSLDCLKTGCTGKIKGRYDRRLGWRYTEGDEHDCPKCGAKYEIAVTDDFEEDALASLVPLVATPPAPETKGGDR